MKLRLNKTKDYMKREHKRRKVRKEKSFSGFDCVRATVGDSRLTGFSVLPGFGNCSKNNASLHLWLEIQGYKVKTGNKFKKQELYTS